VLVCTNPVDEKQVPRLCHEILKLNISSYWHPCPYTNLVPPEESNDVKNKSQTNENAGSFSCLGGCMDLMAVMLAMQPWPRAWLRARFIHNVTSRPTDLHKTSGSLFVSFPSAPPLWSESCFFSSSLYPLLFDSLFLPLIYFIIEFHIRFRIDFHPIFLFTKFKFFLIFCLSFLLLYRSVCLFYSCACMLHYTNYGLHGRIFFPFKDGYFS
jgi:hypothetical protein